MNEVYIKLIDTLKVDRDIVKTCVETGSHHGVGAYTFSTIFETVYSIELSDSLFAICNETYKEDNLHYLHGASTDLLQDLVENIPNDYLLFLDAHGSGGDTTFSPNVGRFGSPVLEELHCVRYFTPEWIIIDDLNDMDKLNTYPSREQIIEKVNWLGEYEEPTIVNYRGRPQQFCFKKK